MATWPQNFPFWFDDDLSAMQGTWFEHQYRIEVRNDSGELLAIVEKTPVARILEERNAPSELHVSIPPNSLAAEFMVSPNYLHVYDENDTEWNAWRIGVVDHVDDADGLEVQVVAYDRLFNLADDVVLDYDEARVGYTVWDHLQNLFNDHQTVGTQPVTLAIGNVSPDIRNFSRTRFQIDTPVTILEFIHKLNDGLNFETYFYVDVDNFFHWVRLSDVVDQGKQVRFDSSLQGIRKSVRWDEQITRVWPRGGFFQEVSGDVTTTRQLKLSDSSLSGVDFLDSANPAVRAAVITNKKFKKLSDADSLYRWAQKRLAVLENPPVNYEIDVVDTSQANIKDFARMIVGEKVYVTDDDLGIQDVQATVVKVERGLGNTLDVKVTLDTEERTFADAITDPTTETPSSTSVDTADPQEVNLRLQDLIDCGSMSGASSTEHMELSGSEYVPVPKHIILDQHDDVEIGTLSAGDDGKSLVYNRSTLKWEPKAIIITSTPYVILSVLAATVPIGAGTPCIVVGQSGGFYQLEKASKDGSNPATGILETSITTLIQGTMMVSGLMIIQGVFSVGQQMWLGHEVLTTERPPNGAVQMIATVVSAESTTSQLRVMSTPFTTEANAIIVRESFNANSKALSTVGTITFDNSDAFETAINLAPASEDYTNWLFADAENSWKSSGLLNCGDLSVSRLATFNGSMHLTDSSGDKFALGVSPGDADADATIHLKKDSANDAIIMIQNEGSGSATLRLQGAENIKIKSATEGLLFDCGQAEAFFLMNSLGTQKWGVSHGFTTIGNEEQLWIGTSAEAGVFINRALRVNNELFFPDNKSTPTAAKDKLIKAIDDEGKLTYLNEPGLHQGLEIVERKYELEIGTESCSEGGSAEEDSLIETQTKTHGLAFESGVLIGYEVVSCTAGGNA